MPRSALPAAVALDYDFGHVQDYQGRESVELFVRILDATIEFLDASGMVRFSRRYSNLRFLVIAEGLLGRDILNQHVCELDGPGLLCSLR